MTLGNDSHELKQRLVDTLQVFKPNETPPEIVDGTLQLGSNFLVCL